MLNVRNLNTEIAFLASRGGEYTGAHTKNLPLEWRPIKPNGRIGGVSLLAMKIHVRILRGFTKVVKFHSLLESFFVFDE